MHASTFHQFSYVSLLFLFFLSLSIFPNPTITTITSTLPESVIGRCYNCGEFANHIAAKCTMGPQPKRCHYCKSEDHLIAECSQRPEKVSVVQMECLEPRYHN